MSRLGMYMSGQVVWFISLGMCMSRGFYTIEQWSEGRGMMISWFSKRISPCNFNEKKSSARDCVHLGTKSFCEGFAATEAPKRFCVGSYASRAANRGPLEWSEWPWGPRIPSRMSGNLREKTLQKGCVWSRAKIFERAVKQGHEDDGFKKNKILLLRTCRIVQGRKSKIISDEWRNR